MGLQEQVAIVTGASRGIGKAIALELARQGAFVVGTATSDKGAEGIQSYLKEEGLSGKGLMLDVSNATSVEIFSESLKAAELTATILVNNAGITQDNLIMRMKEDEWDKVINTNLSSIYRMCKLCTRGMMKARKGRIINISSVVGLSGNAGQSNYAAAKAGMIGFTKSLASELGSRGITVNVVAPGFIGTDMTEALTDEQKESMLSQIPLARLGNAEEIAKAVYFLASDASGYITGETINVNGGMYMA